jgi:uncharacterized protein YqeY
MQTKQALENALKDAMRERDEVRRRTLRMALASIKMAEIEKGTTLEDVNIASILQKEIKIRREAIQDAEKANRPDLIQDAQAEIAVLESFLPKGLSDDEIRQIILQAIQESNATTPADMGKVMKIVLPRIQGRAPNDKVSSMVRNALQPQP